MKKRHSLIISLAAVLIAVPLVGVASVYAEDRSRDDADSRRIYERRMQDNISVIESHRDILKKQQEEQLDAERRQTEALKDAREERAETLRREFADQDRSRAEHSLQARKTALMNIIDAMIARAEHIKDMVTKKDMGSSDLGRSIVAELSTTISKLQALKEKTENAQTLEDIRAIAQEVRDIRKSFTEIKIRQFITLSHIARLQTSVIDRAMQRAEAIQDVLDELESQRVVIRSAQSLLDDAARRHTSIENQMDALHDRIESSSANLDLEAVRAELADIKNQLHTVYDIFKQTAQRIDRTT